MRKITLCAGVAALALAGVALAAGAQGIPGGFGDRGPRPGGPGEGTFEFRGLVGGFGGRTVTGKPFQATFTVTHNESLAGGNSISNTTTGTLARGTDGSTYRDVKLPAIGPWASSGKTPEFSSIRNLSTLMEYIVNVTKGTYEAFAIHQHNPPPGGGAKRGPGGNGQGGPDPKPDLKNVTMADNPNGTYTDPATKTVYSPVDDRTVTRTIPAGQIGNAAAITITSERWYSAALGIVLEETRSDPRFGTTTYQLSTIVAGQPPASLFVPNPAFTQVQRKGFKGRGFRGQGQQGPPPPAD
ncbi:MAG TPA: hypothetical protein VNZ56_03265 [Verrucomicrobiae bacterium]|nr:hypothetical protein [Verrucomicrobiae bacterium]